MSDGDGTGKSHAEASRRVILGSLVGGVALAGMAAAPAVAGPRTPDTASAPEWGPMWMDVKEHGAVGDGKTDDTHAIQSAMDSAPEAGAVVVFPPGEYAISSTLYPGTRQTLLGFYPHSIVRAISGVTGFTIFDTSRAAGGAVRFKGLVVDGNRKGTKAPPIRNPGSAARLEGVGILVTGVRADNPDNEVMDCEVRENHNTGIVTQLLPRGVDNVVQMRAERVRSHHNSGEGIFYYQATDSRVIDCVLDENGKDGMNHWLCSGTLVRGTQARNNAKHGLAFLYSSDFRITESNCSGNGTQPSHFGWGIVVGGANLNVTPNHDYTIANNRCDRNGSGGISLDPTLPGDRLAVQPSRATLVGNVCSSDGKIGINGIYLNHAKSVTVTGNVCHGFPYGGINVSYPSYAVIVGNVSFNNKHGIGVESTKGPEPYGHVAIGPNICYDNEEDFFIPQDYPSNYQEDIAVLEPRDYLALTASKMGFFGSSPVQQPGQYHVTGSDTDRSYDANTAGLRELSHVVATLISDLKQLGLIA